MPELPDVENFKRYLDATALHNRIAAAEVGNTKILRRISAREIGERLAGRRLESGLRHGKHLLIELDDGGWVTFHFGMTGRFKYFRDMADDPRHDRLRLDFDNGCHRAFDCRRMIGEVGLVDDAEAIIAEERLGPDALAPDLDEAAFKARLAGKRGRIKSALMDQELIAGIGNVYSDEILFQARIDPNAKVGDLDDGELSVLYRKMRAVLETAIERGAGSEELFERLPSHYLLPHRAKGETCPQCGGEIEPIKVSGRTAYWCPKCQKS